MSDSAALKAGADWIQYTKEVLADAEIVARTAAAIIAAEARVAAAAGSRFIVTVSGGTAGKRLREESANGHRRQSDLRSRE